VKFELSVSRRSIAAWAGSSQIALALLTAIAVVVAVTSVPSCSRDPKKEFDYVRVQLNGQPVLGVTKRGVEPRGVVVFFHGLDKDQFILTADEIHTHLTDVLTSSGFAVVAGQAGGNAFGNPDSQNHYAAITKMGIERFRVQNVFFLAESMGALAAINLLASPDSKRVRGLAAISPALNLESTPPQYRDAVAAAYPGEPLESVNPLNLPVEAMQGKKLRFYVTPQDAIVSTKKNARAFDARFGSVADISIVDCTGAHLDASCIQPEDIVAWFKKLEYRVNP
jgi:pimeloyl-ACP methyl ester carboxylesterase